MIEDHVPARSRIWLFALGALVITFLVLPVLIVIPVSFSASTLLEFPPRAYSLRWYRELLGSLEWRDAADRQSVDGRGRDFRPQQPAACHDQRGAWA